MGELITELLEVRGVWGGLEGPEFPRLGGKGVCPGGGHGCVLSIRNVVIINSNTLGADKMDECLI